MHPIGRACDEADGIPFLANHVLLSDWPIQHSRSVWSVCLEKTEKAVAVLQGKKAAVAVLELGSRGRCGRWRRCK